MKKIYFFLNTNIVRNCTGVLSLLLIILAGGHASAQVSGSNMFLQGAYVEIGMNNNASFGACGSSGAIPSGYHPRPGSNLAEVYDWGHDGWTVGTPAYMGDYTFPGSPFEGWELQIGTPGNPRCRAFQNCAGTIPGSTPGGMTMTGSLTAYSNIGGRATGTWTGTANVGAAGVTLAIRQETVVDTFASAVVVTTVLTNTSGAVAPNVYYLRSCDPDNTQTWPGGGFPTRNQIIHQNEDARHRVLVQTTHGSFTVPQSFMGLGTRDCRAKCFIYNSWPLSTAVDLSTVWAETYAPAQYTLGGCWPASCAQSDIAIGLVYNLGNIAAGDSTIISYAYIWNGVDGIDSAFPDPQIVINGTPKPTNVPPNPDFDTFNVCDYPGMTNLPIDLRFAADRGWSWSDWTWSPGLGLSATTGTHVDINTTALPPTFTYTITGTDSLTGMTSCHNKTFYLTIHTCNGAESNSPCAGDTLWLNAPGDSTAATYQWYGPAPSTSVFATTQKTFIYPASTAHNGMFSVIKTVGGIPDTSLTLVTVHHKPTVSASSNSPLCIGSANTLLLTSVCDSPGVTYSWTATPPPFTSTLPNPTIPSFAESDTGMYRVIVESVFGCKDTAETRVSLAPVPSPPIVTAVNPYCQDDVFVPFTISGLVPGGSTLWYPSFTGGVGSTVTPTVNTAVPGLNTFFFSQIIGSCEGPRDSIEILVNPKPATIVGPMGVCQFFTTTLSSPTPGGAWSSSNPAIATVDASTGVVTGVNGGTVRISYTLPTTCRRSTIVTVHPKPAPPTFAPHRECQYTIPNTATASGTNLTWYGLGVTAGSPLAPVPNTDTIPGIYNYYVTQTSAFGCVSDSAVYPVRIVAEPDAPITEDTVYCQHFDAPPLTAIGSNLLWYETSTSTPGTPSAPKPSTAVPGLTTYYVSQTVDQCESPRAGLDVTVLYLPEFKITPDRPWVCQFDSLGMEYDGPTLVEPGYAWGLPDEAYFVNGTRMDDERVVIGFHRAIGKNTVKLTASNYNGRCKTTKEIDIKVVPAPEVQAYIKPDVCINDTINLALQSRSDNSYKYVWTVNDAPMFSSTDIDIVSYNSNSGGPYVVSWPNKGKHIIKIQGFTVEGCKSLVTADTVKVHELPDARFDFVTDDKKKLCIEDSVLFIAKTQDYANNYKWEPEHFFVNQNKPTISGRVELTSSMVRLTVTDPFGCYSSYTRQINPDQCCTVQFPSAFTPNGDNKNDVFRPIFAGYHRFHIFRVSNRWGQTVFESANSKPSWDGTFNGIPQDMGTYFYYIKYDCGGKTQEAKGDITLIR